MKITRLRPWGMWQVINEENYDNLIFKTKLITVKPGKSLSMQKHSYRKEVWTVVSGLATVFNKNMSFSLFPGDTVVIRKGDWHQLSNETKELVVVHEVQIGEICEEDDIERKE